MGLFGKKKDGSHSCCSESVSGENMARAESAKAAPGIKVLGAGCPKCARPRPLPRRRWPSSA